MCWPTQLNHDELCAAYLGRHALSDITRQSILTKYVFRTIQLRRSMWCTLSALEIPTAASAGPLDLRPLELLAGLGYGPFGYGIVLNNGQTHRVGFRPGGLPTGAWQPRLQDVEIPPVEGRWKS